MNDDKYSNYVDFYHIKLQFIFIYKRCFWVREYRRLFSNNQDVGRRGYWASRPRCTNTWI